MGRIIAVTGKGGVGKTTVSSLIVGRLLAGGKAPVLAIDADPNSCLDACLGVKAEKTVGSAREEVREETELNPGISKNELLHLKIAESLVESKGFDLISMGRPEGPGCYCYANNVLKSVIAEIAGQYPYVVLDNEAGLENLSRRIVQEVDVLALVSDPSNAGLDTLLRLHSLAGEMGIKYKKLVVIINKIRSGVLPARMGEIERAVGADAVLGLPDNDEIAAIAEQNGTFLGIAPDNEVALRLGELIDAII